MKSKIRQMKIDGLEIVVTRKDVKRFNLRIKPDGSLSLSVPRCASDASIFEFIRENRVKIDRFLDRFKETANRQKPLGEYTEDDRQNLKRRVEERLPLIEARTGLYANGVTIRRMSGRWGSCNTVTHHINLSIMLADKPDRLLDYVIVHELVHTRVSNHGPEFKAYMDMLVPEWRVLRRELKG